MTDEQVVRLTRRLVDIPSVTGEEREVGDFLSGELTALGFGVEAQEVTPTRSNVLVLPEGARAVLCTHMDTVAPFIPSSEDDTHLWGRGACDAKGILAAMVAAAVRLREREYPVGMLFVVGEETDSVGAKTANKLSPGTDFLVVGEPTEGLLASGHKGMLAFELAVQGEAAHSAYPHLGDSAVHRLLDILSRVRGHDWGEDAVLGAASVNVGSIEGGVAMNVVAPTATATVSIRLVGSVAAARAALAGLTRDERVSVRMITESSAVRCESVDGFPSVPVAFGTDLFHLTRWGRPLLMGPGSIHFAHRDDERIEKRALLRAVDDYVRLVVGVLG